MSKIKIVVEVEAVALALVLGKEYTRYHFYDGKVWSSARSRVVKPIGFKTKGGKEVVQFSIRRASNWLWPHGDIYKVQWNLSDIQKKVDEFNIKEGK